MRVLLITRGHPFQREPFFAMIDAVAERCPGMSWHHAEHPAAQAVFEPAYAAEFDAFLFYDMPGIRFADGGGIAFDPPPARLRENLAALTKAGKGLVFLHHAIAGWPAWPEYASLVGGRFMYLPETLRGQARQDSGYRFDVTHTVRPLREHPVTAGVQPFEITDEVYLYEVFEDDLTPLLASDYAFMQENFYSAAKVVLEGKMFDNEGWRHAPGSNLVGWTRTQDASRIVYLQCGDGPVAYGCAPYQQLVANALRYVVGRA